MDSLITKGAVEVVELLKRGEVSALELVECSAARIAQTDPAINAVPTLCLDRARAHARRLMSRPRDEPSLLAGLPIVVKDNVDVGGVRATGGSRIFADRIAPRSDPLVERLESHGAVVMGKSNLPEFACGGNTFNEVFGATTNPWNTRMSAGGSSGGSAAALAAGQVWLATGNDFAGSIRVPASFCSIVGFRPSPGMIPRIQKQPFSPLSIEGTMARSVEDAALMFEAEVGGYLADPLTQFGAPAGYLAAAHAPVRPARIAWSADLGVAPALDPEVRRVCGEAIGRLNSDGARLDEAHPDLTDAARHFEVLRGAVYTGRVGPLLDKHRHLLKPEVIENAEYGLSLSAADVVASEIAQGELIRRTAAFFETYDLLICPAAICPPYPVEERYVRRVGDSTFENHLQWLVLTYVITMTCCPSISIPCGFTREGLPVGLQLVGRPRGERELLSHAAYVERLFSVSPRTPLDPRSA